MKFPAIVAVLLISAVPAFAAGRTASPTQWKDIHELYKIYNHCGGYDGEDDLELKKTCVTVDKLIKKLTAQGFCIRGHIMVGRPSKDGKHCYVMHDPSPQ